MPRRLVPAKPRSNADIDGLALNIVRKYQPGMLNNEERFDIERFFDCELEGVTNVKTAYQELECGIHGFTDSETMISVISLDLMDDPREELFCRSTMAHETGHAILHVWDYRRKKAILKSIHNKNHMLRNYREDEIVLYMNPEWQAWRFAGALLMPKPAFRKAVKNGLDEQDLSKRFGVNPAFVRTRARALKIPI